MFDALFKNLAAGFSQEFGGPYADAVASWPGVPVYDDGGSITAPAAPVTADCKAQVCAPTQAMRADAGFVQTDMRLMLIGLDTPPDTSTTVVIASGPHAGTWQVMSAVGDSAGVGWSCRGRRA